MNIKLLAITSIATAAIVTGCSKKADNAGQDYKLDVVVANAGAEGTYAYLYDFDTNDVIDSVMVADGHAVFNGHIDNPAVVSLVINGSRAGRFFLEGGESVYDNGHITSELNDKYDNFVANIRAVSDSLMSNVDSLMTEAEQEARYLLMQTHIDSLVNKHIVENIANPLGYYLLVQQAISKTTSLLARPHQPAKSTPTLQSSTTAPLHASATTSNPVSTPSSTSGQAGAAPANARLRLSKTCMPSTTATDSTSLA